jgi:hypothetical protein
MKQTLRSFPKFPIILSPRAVTSQSIAMQQYPQGIQLQAPQAMHVPVPGAPTRLVDLGDRATPHNGLTAPKAPGLMQFSDWELDKPGCCVKMGLACRCSTWDDSRSYLYIRDNGSLEINDTNGIKNCFTCCCKVQDNIFVYYFDRDPYAAGPRGPACVGQVGDCNWLLKLLGDCMAAPQVAPNCKLGPYPWCFCCYTVSCSKVRRHPSTLTPPFLSSLHVSVSVSSRPAHSLYALLRVSRSLRLSTWESCAAA